jgi:hypothetical protein
LKSCRRLKWGRMMSKYPPESNIKTQSEMNRVKIQHLQIVIGALSELLINKQIITPDELERSLGKAENIAASRETDPK